MIWSSHAIIPPEAFAISADDRILEHGIGLFETFRTYNRRAPSLARHRGRLMRSAQALGIALDPELVPDEKAVRDLMAACGINGEARVRITLSGGSPERGLAAKLWMRAQPLAAEAKKTLALSFAPWTIEREDPLARHKSVNYWSRRLAWEYALGLGRDDALITSADGQVWEASRANLFVIQGGRMATPPISGPIVPGIMRSAVLEWARTAGFAIDEREIDRSEIDQADELFLTNSVRGIMPVMRILDRSLEAPGELTRECSSQMAAFWREGDTA